MNGVSSDFAIMYGTSNDSSLRELSIIRASMSIIGASGCQIRRESAHGETVCCNNVKALFDELPTPHLIVEITLFPAGPPHKVITLGLKS
ncbi:hypothetical protein Tco_1260256 [Tanacetum coccineum]